LYGYGFEPELLANTVRAYWPMKLGDGMIYPADQEILDNKMNLNRPSRSLVPSAVAEGMEAQGDTEVDLSDARPLRLNAAQYEKYAVLAGGNQVEAAKLGLELPHELLGEVVEGLSSNYTGTPPRDVRSLDDFLDWVITQPEYRDSSPGPQGGKEQIFQQAVRTYRQLGLQLLLAQDDALSTRYEQSLIQRQVQRLPLPERPSAIQDLQEGYRAARPERRESLGLRVGAPR
jgi:hypothetical protein